MNHKKIKPLVILTIMVLILVGIGTIFYARESSKENLKSEEKDISEIKEEKDDKEDIVDTENSINDSSNAENDLDKNNETNEVTNDTKKEVSNSNTSNSSYNSSNSNTSTSNSSTNQSNTTSQELIEEVKEQPQTSNDANSNVSSNNDSKEVDTNSFFYSIHQGTIDTKTMSGCLGGGEEIAFIDTVDINYYRCYEVTAKDGSILGYYLNIFCNSGNCSRYKSQIDWSKYN